MSIRFSELFSLLSLPPLIVGGVLFVFGVPGFAADLNVQILRQPKNQITKLTWDNSPTEVVIESFGDERRSVARIRGRYVQSDWNLLYGSEHIKPTAQGDFQIAVPLIGKTTAFEMVAISPLGRIEKETLTVSYPKWEPVKGQPRAKPAKKYAVASGLGYSMISFKQTHVPDFSETALTAKISGTYFFPPTIDVGVSAYMTVLPITTNSDVSAKILGVNLRVGYVLPYVREPWRLSILGGLYYTTMFVTAERFGFQHMMGPQLFPAIRRILSSRSSVSGYLKYSPVTDGLSVLSLSNREIAGGGAYTRLLNNGHSLSATLDIASISLSLRNVAISSASVSLGCSYGF